MINEVIVQRLDELIGDYDTPFFNYLLYSYGLSLNECELIVGELKSDVNSGRIIPENIVETLDDYFIKRVTGLEKQEKLEFLRNLVRKDSDFYVKYLKEYDLSDDEINLICSRVESKIHEENISDFQIKRYLEYYFSNSIKQASYIRELERIVGRNYDTLLIVNMKSKYPILKDSDIVQIIFNIRGEVLEAREFKNGIKEEFRRQCLLKSEDKKARCRVKLSEFVEGSGDSFSKLIKFKRLTKAEGDYIVSQIEDDISEGLIQPDEITGAFITKRFNDYNERK
ncbi:hypothetical protein [Methanobrevibacter sp.]|uniref:hypothetical protein n=1 Tax=Methanobrevibacter sp. TaxID=66852 RepID=UPI00386F3DD6